ncbi:MAG: flagellar motor switch phosphatase FliY [Bacillota bacterium]
MLLSRKRRLKMMSDEEKDMLSQDEIDALVNNEDDAGGDTDSGGATGKKDLSEKELLEEEKDVLGEIGNIAMGAAATTLYTLLDKKVEITAPEVSVDTFEEVSEEYERPCVLNKVEYVEGLEGINILIFNQKDAAIIADLMMGGDGTDVELELDEIHLSAVAEVMNQMMGSASTSLSSILDSVVNITPPDAKYLDMETAVEQSGSYFKPDKKVVSTSFSLKIGDLIDSRFKQLAPVSFTRQLVKKLMNKEGGLTVKEGSSQQKEVDQFTESRTVRDEEAAGDVSESKPQQEQKQQVAATTATASGNVSKEQEVGVKKAQFPDFDEEIPETVPKNMELIKDVPLEVTVRLGKSRMTISEILDLGEGSIVELDKLAGEPVDLLVNGKLVAKGEVVVIDENFGFRVKDIVNPLERIGDLG